MPTAHFFATPDGLAIHFLEDGAGDPVVLLHGFAASAELNWVAPGLCDAVAGARFRVLAPDARGHGASDKPHDPDAYRDDAMPRDVSALLDHAGLDSVHLVGYSMGALVGQRVAVLDRRVRSLLLGGIGGRLLTARLDREAIAAALDGPDDAVTDETARAFRAFARSTGADLQALAASQRAGRPSFDTLGEIAVPTLVLAGEDDDLAGDPAGLAAAIPGARAATVPGDHLTAVAQPAFRDALVAWLVEQSTAGRR